MTQTWLGTYALGGEDHDQFAAIADPAAIACFSREPTIERGYGRGYDDVSRAAFMRNAAREAAEAERAEASAAREQAREALRRQMLGVDRKWFWDFAIGVRNDLIAQRSEALLSRDHFAHASIDRRLEQLETDLVKIERLQLIWEQRR